MEKPKQHVKSKVLKTQVHAEQNELEEYIESDNRCETPTLHKGADVSRPLNAMRLAEYRKCPDCINIMAKPGGVLIQFKTPNGTKKIVTVCGKHWEKLAGTVIGWSGE